jgi:glycine cleavage system H protein
MPDATPPDDRKYLPTHEWHKAEGNLVTIGITQIAADELTDVTFVSLPKVGAKLEANARFGEIESVKATSDMYIGVAGTVTKVNDELAKNPGLVNTDPYGKGWMIQVQTNGDAKLEGLLSAADYMTKTGH